jgi:DNA-binding response OmpR family regulator
MDDATRLGERPPRLLLVDDDERFAAIVGGMLEDDGYHVVGIVTRAVDVPGAAGELAPDLVILDLVLADGDGLMVADWLRQDGHEGPILLFSSLWDRRIEEATLSEGYGYVQKVDGIDALEAAIDATLDEPSV